MCKIITRIVGNIDRLLMEMLLEQCRVHCLSIKKTAGFALSMQWRAQRRVRFHHLGFRITPVLFTYNHAADKDDFWQQGLSAESLPLWHLHVHIKRRMLKSWLWNHFLFYHIKESLSRTEGSVTEAVLVICFVGVRVTFSVKFNL